MRELLMALWRNIGMAMRQLPGPMLEAKYLGDTQAHRSFFYTTLQDFQLPASAVAERAGVGAHLERLTCSAWATGAPRIRPLIATM
jgi:hypothetical protein